MSTPRQDALQIAARRTPRTFARPLGMDGLPLPVREYFGSHTFDIPEMRERLQARVVDRFIASRQEKISLDRDLADAIAGAALQWALEHGATHFCHWFQPMTGFTAEKHDGFILYGRGRAMAEFTGAQLIQSEPDASSFPSGGIRSTFEARGYTVWDPSSPMFIAQRETGATLCIPSCFFSYTGEALDKKIPLLRSMRAVEREALALCNTIGDPARHAHVTAGPEQEYFLVDKAWVALRPDLKIGGRTVLGQRAAKGQSLEDHYFGSIPDRVQAFMNEIEVELYRLGVPAKTRHNEVAPSQFELAVVYDEANVAADHNQLVMETMRRVADRHDLVCLLHEKPFAGVNGSGKHLNWSMSVSGLGNMLEPGAQPHENLRFLAFLSAILVGVHRHAGVLRAAIASHGNDFRLGANEAPPAIISVFLGDQLSAVVRELVEGQGNRAGLKQANQGLGVPHLPPILRDNTDRNRTSPFAFTGNKFEFRAVGSHSSISLPLACLNTVVADGLQQVRQWIEEAGPCTDDTIMAAIVRGFRESAAICFEGNNYSEEWVEEAARRGLPNLRKTPEALDQFGLPSARELFERHNVLSAPELESRHHVKLEQYLTTFAIEVDLLRDMVDQQVLPAAIEERTVLAADLAALRGALGTVDPAEEAPLRTFSALLATLRLARQDLDRELNAANELDSAPRAHRYAGPVQQRIDEVRAACDALEAVIADHRWPLPRYREILFHA